MSLIARGAVAVLLVSCSPHERATRARSPAASAMATATAGASSASSASIASASPHPAAPRDCIIAGDDEAPVTVEGTLRQGESPGHLVLRLLEPRCAVGVARASVLTEVMLVSDGFDLRPLVGARIRAVGRALGDASVPEGPAVIVVARSVERLAAKEAP